MKWESCDSANPLCKVNLHWILPLFVDFAHSARSARSALLLLQLLLFCSATATVQLHLLPVQLVQLLPAASNKDLLHN